MSPRGHVVVAGVGAAAIFPFSKEAAAAHLVAGVLVDVDHFLDYWFQYGFTVDYPKIAKHCSENRFDKNILLFHSFELLLLLIAATFFIFLSGTPGALWLGAVSGFAVHMICDQLVNTPLGAGYFFLKRAVVGFRSKEIFDAELYAKLKLQSGRLPLYHPKRFFMN